MTGGSALLPLLLGWVIMNHYQDSLSGAVAKKYACCRVFQLRFGEGVVVVVVVAVFSDLSWVVFPGLGAKESPAVPSFGVRLLPQHVVRGGDFSALLNLRLELKNVQKKA